MGESAFASTDARVVLGTSLFVVGLLFCGFRLERRQWMRPVAKASRAAVGLGSAR